MHGPLCHAFCTHVALVTRGVNGIVSKDDLFFWGCGAAPGLFQCRVLAAWRGRARQPEIFLDS